MGKIKDSANKIKAENVSFFTDFKKFITKGNVLDMAVGVVIGTAFNAIVTGLVKNIITPLMEMATNGIAIEDWKWVLEPEVLDEAGAVVTPEVAVTYGLWLQAIIDFFIIALCIFAAVRFIKSLERKMNAKEIAKAEAEAAAKSEADAKAAADAAAAADAEKAALAEFYANVKEQTELLRELSKK